MSSGGSARFHRAPLIWPCFSCVGARFYRSTLARSGDVTPRAFESIRGEFSRLLAYQILALLPGRRFILFCLNYSIKLTSTLKNTCSLEHLTFVLVFLVYELEIEIPISHPVRSGD